MNTLRRNRPILLCLVAALLPLAVRGETPDEWVALGRRVHGGFGSFIALGIRIGLDARKRLGAGPRELDVTYQDGPKSPCSCVVDGIMIATVATPGQGSLRVGPAPAGAAHLGVVVIKHARIGKALRYTLPDSARALLAEWNQKPERERYDAVMRAPQDALFRIETLPAAPVPAANGNHERTPR